MTEVPTARSAATGGGTAPHTPARIVSPGRGTGPAFGLVLPTREVTLRAAPDTRPLLAMAVEAERRGYASLWVGDSPLARPRLEPLTLLGAVAGVTDRALIGTAALNGVLRQPVAAAWQLASVDRLARGRLVVGVGSGFPSADTRAEMAALSAPWPGRARRLVETVALWRALWADRPTDDPAPPRTATVGGQSWRLDELGALVRPHRSGGPPVWCAGDGSGVVDTVARHFDGWLPYPPDADRYRRRIEAMVADARRPVTPALYATVAVDADEGAARAAADAYCRAYYRLPVDAVASVQLVRCGTVARVADELSAFVAAGARHIVLRAASLHPERHLDTLDAVVAELGGHAASEHAASGQAGRLGPEPGGQALA